MKNKLFDILGYAILTFVLMCFFAVFFGICNFLQIPQTIDYSINGSRYISETATAYVLTPEALRPTQTATPVPTQLPDAAWGDTYLQFPEGTEDVIIVYSGYPSTGYSRSDANYTLIAATYYCLVDGRYRECIPVVLNVSDLDR